MKLKKIIIDNFKGVKHMVISFSDGITLIEGRNGSRKSTIGTAHNWLWKDCDISLKSNPNIRMLGSEDLTPRVEEVIDIGGTEISVAKIQKKSSKSGNISNSYEINSVAKSKTEFEEYFKNKGIDFKNFLFLSNPLSFMGQKSKDMRALLFKMASEKTDLEIAEGMDGVAETAEMLKTYTLEEIEAMQKQEIRKITEVHGKNGELTSAKIEGLESAKVDIDIAERELQKNALQEQISDIDNHISHAGKLVEDLREKEMKIRFEISGIMQEMNADVASERMEVKEQIGEADRRIAVYKGNLESAQRRLEAYKHEQSTLDAQKDPINAEYKANNAKQFDESPYELSEDSKICPTCGKPFDEDKVAELVANATERRENARKAFLAEKNARKTQLLEKAKTIKEKLATLEKSIADTENEIATLQRNIESTENTRSGLVDLLSELPESADYAKNADYSRLKAEQDKITAEITKAEDGGYTESVAKMKAERQELVEQLDEVKSIIAKASRNDEIDEQIENLQKQGGDYEQQKADAEKVLYQLKEISERKEDLLTQEINSHFNVVVWRLWNVQKNGERVPDCVPTINGKDFGVSTNTGLEILARIDICHSLQKFFGCTLPIWLDNSESLDKGKLPNLEDTQIIALRVEDCDLKVESEGK